MSLLAEGTQNLRTQLWAAGQLQEGAVPGPKQLGGRGVRCPHCGSGIGASILVSSALPSRWGQCMETEHKLLFLTSGQGRKRAGEQGELSLCRAPLTAALGGAGGTGSCGLRAST